jgi:DNA topoisomerase-2
LTPPFASIQEIQFRSFSSVLADYDNGKTIEEQYSKKTPLEHVLLRPGMYVGPVERLPPNHCWVLEPTPTPQSMPTSSEKIATPAYRIVHKEYGIIPALIKIFDEILVNASDNRLRSPKSCTRLDVIIDPGSKDRDPFISIRNDGKGIPIQIHKEENMYVP